MRRIVWKTASLAVLCAILTCCNHKQTVYNGDGMEEDISARAEWETQMLADPATGLIPENIRAKELAFATTLPAYKARAKNGWGLWQNAGPDNVGGRTRALAIDVNNAQRMFAAGVSGGLWLSTNGGQSWQKLQGPTQMLNITCLVQDTRKDKTNTWYAGTGEFIGNSASGNAAFYLGDGILKSTDGGLTWKPLASTTIGKPQNFSKDFNFVNNIVINTADTGNTLFAAVYGSVYKSVDGGEKWSKVRGSINFSAPSAYTDVAVTPKGVFYATLSSDGDQRGIWRSADGISWTNITPAGFAGKYNRVVIGIDPQNEDNVYFLGYTPGFGKRSVDFRGKEDWASFYKYTYLSGDGSGNGGKWEDRSQNLPGFGGDFGDFNTQTGYNLYVKIHPANSNIIYLGCTNLFRSTDAFSTKNNWSWIGGYNVNTSRPDYEVYPNQHPDQHNLVFSPSNPNIMYAACDGGVYKTMDNTAQNVSWESMNSGYVTSQFYTIAIDHATPFNNEIMGGLQDNSTFITRDFETQKNWVMPGKGDGSFCYITNGRTDYYLSSQNGKTYRVVLDAKGNRIQSARVDPLGAKVTNFINPFTIDPNNQERMYFVGGTRLWVNDDVTQIPLHNYLDTNAVNTGWSKLSTQTDSSQEISAVAVSNSPGNRLYYGTEKGKLYRIDEASTGNKNAVNITGSQFPLNAYINNITIDPEDANKVLVVFSNYNVQSVFYTTNGGTNWVAVSGNLEQFSNGTGNGPSCRWSAILPVKGKRAYFMATSTGLYSTDTLKGPNTVWTQQDPEGIGNNICVMIDSRPADGFVAVATHGNGVYTGRINYTYQVTGITENNGLNTSVKIYPNPVRDYANIEIVAEKAGKAQLQLVDETGRTITEQTPWLQSGKNVIPIKNIGWKKGIYYCRISVSGKAISKAFIVQ